MDSSSSSTPPPPPWDSLLDELKDQAFSFLPAAADRGAVAAVCKRWRDAERHSRRRLTVHNCYAVAPGYAVQKFPSVRAAVVKGMPHFADFGCLPPDWGAFAEPWVAAAAQSWPLLEELSFKRMVVTDQCLHMIASSFSNLQVLRINRCMGFSTTGLAAITQACRSVSSLSFSLPKLK
jgi:transport inhibitor response 1